MGLAVLYSRSLAGMNAEQVTVEVHLANGLPNFTIVGLPETEVKESKDRVRAALQNCQFEFPQRRITVSNPRPGEISIAMNGVLFLDELYTVACWKCCANRWKAAASLSRARHAVPISKRNFNSSPR